MWWSTSTVKAGISSKIQKAYPISSVVVLDSSYIDALYCTNAFFRRVVILVNRTYYK